MPSRHVRHARHARPSDAVIAAADEALVPLLLAQPAGGPFVVPFEWAVEYAPAGGDPAVAIAALYTVARTWAADLAADLVPPSMLVTGFARALLAALPHLKDYDASGRHIRGWSRRAAAIRIRAALRAPDVARAVAAWDIPSGANGPGGSDISDELSKLGRAASLLPHGVTGPRYLRMLASHVPSDFDGSMRDYADAVYGAFKRAVPPAMIRRAVAAALAR